MPGRREAPSQQFLPFSDEPTHDERFAEWMKGHGSVVYAHFVDIAREIRSAGQSRYGGKAIAEIARYRRIIEGRDAEGYKVNNSYISLMVRKLIGEDTTFATFFEMRKLKEER